MMAKQKYNMLCHHFSTKNKNIIIVNKKIKKYGFKKYILKYTKV